MGEIWAERGREEDGVKQPPRAHECQCHDYDTKTE